MEKPLIYCYEKCSTCKKALKWLKEKRLDFDYKEITEEPPSAEDFLEFFEKTGLPERRFFNTSGLKYRELGLKDKLDKMSKQEKAELLSSDGMLIKRPLLILPNKIIPGFKIAEWVEALKEHYGF